MEEFAGVIGKWEATVRKYESRKDLKGLHIKLSSELKMTSCEQLLRVGLESHPSSMKPRKKLR